MFTQRLSLRLGAVLAVAGSLAAAPAASAVRDIQELPKRQGGALVMRELGGLTVAEIAGALQMTPAAAKQAIYEARSGLREATTPAQSISRPYLTLLRAAAYISATSQVA